MLEDENKRLTGTSEKINVNKTEKNKRREFELDIVEVRRFA